jgi:AcrR family transcriptional regulator
VESPSPVRPPVQARSRRTLARIVEASRRLIADGGRDALTVQDVIARARVSVGSFYARFAGRDDLLRYLDQEQCARERERWEAELGAVAVGSSLERRVRALVGLILSASDVSAETHGALRTVAAKTLLDAAELVHPDPETAIELAYFATVGVARHRPTALPAPRLEDELVRMWLGYLGGNAAKPDDAPGAVDFFNVWA